MVTRESDQKDIVTFLLKPETHDLLPDEGVQHVETHASHIFLAGDRAYKLKKQVAFTFLDFSTCEKRKAACEKELSRNRRTAPEIYLGLVPVRVTSNGLRLDGEDGEVVDWLVEMKRFESNGLLATLAEKGELALHIVELLATDIADFHQKAEIAQDFGGAEGIARIVRENWQDMQPSLGGVLDREKAVIATRLSEVEIARHQALLEERRLTGHVRHCHGDLHLGNVTMVDDRPVIFDCIEFSERLARIDTLYDLAFLLMDLAFRAGKDERLRGYANRALNTYLDRFTHDETEPACKSLALLPLFMSMRAVVRAKVTAMQVKEGDDAKVALARAYLDFALQQLKKERPKLIAVGGLSGTGKSTIAKELAIRVEGAAGAVHLRTDIIRKRMFGAGPLDRLPEAVYTPEAGARVYAEMLRLAGIALDAGMSVVLDAVFAREGERDEAAEIAAKRSLSFTGLWLEAPAAVLEARVAAREKRGDDPSDAGVEVLRRQLSYDLGRMTWARMDASGAPKEVLTLAEAALASSRPFL